MRNSAGDSREIGELLQDFVNDISHRRGRTLAVMTEEAVTLQQVLLLHRLFEARSATPTELAGQLHMSLSSLSQMIERLNQLGLVTRTEMSDDRRKKTVKLTRKGQALLGRVREARSLEYSAGVARLSPPVRAELARALLRALGELAGYRPRPSSPD
ncbi:MAG: MarR family transcriptional regulator [Alphaproteobacteria bacterium]|nr:MarR family transcriptional regulator [Alphaproteobacteria bacterium]